MLLTIERLQVEHDVAVDSEARPGRSLEARALVGHDHEVVALRHRPVVALGALPDRRDRGERSANANERLVTAADIEGRAYWIPADAVWSDADHAADPQHPRPVGLATGRNRQRTLAVGLSDRLGWEAVLAYDRGDRLPEVSELPVTRGERLVVLDGRLGHDVPTVVVLGDDFIRWGAAATWSTAVHRALYGDNGILDIERELSDITTALRSCGLEVVGVDLGSDVLRRAGVDRCSVQLVLL
jgi:hypothetical protein